VAELSGLDPELTRRLAGRVDMRTVQRELRRGSSEVVSAYDTNVAIADPNPASQSSRFDDPVLDAMTAPLSSAIIHHLTDTLNYRAEGALKVREASRFPAEGYDLEYLLHGHAVPLNGDDRLILVTPPGSDGLVDGVARAAELESVPVTVVSDASDLPPVLAQIPLTARLQMLALRFALERGQNPDLVITGAWADEGLWAIGSPAAR